MKAIADLERALSAGSTRDWWADLVDSADKMSDADARAMLDRAAQQLHGPHEFVLAHCKQQLADANADPASPYATYWSRLLQRLSRAAGL
jgi:hypothetical protein